MIKRKLRKWLKEKKLVEQDEFYYQLFIRKLQNKENFSFSRFGDGEWNAIFNVEGENCDGHQYFDDMGEALKAIFSTPKSYYLGIQPMSVRMFLPEIVEVVHAHNQHFFNADIFHKASDFGLLAPFLSALAQREVMVVGPSYLQDLSQPAISEHIVIPQQNCWLEKEKTLSDIRKALESKEDVVVVFMASMASNVYIDILQGEYGNKHSFLDLGSLLDPYAGKQTRDYHKRLKV